MYSIVSDPRVFVKITFEETCESAELTFENHSFMSSANVLTNPCSAVILEITLITLLNFVVQLFHSHILCLFKFPRCEVVKLQTSQDNLLFVWFVLFINGNSLLENSPPFSFINPSEFRAFKTCWPPSSSDFIVQILNNLNFAILALSQF